LLGAPAPVFGPAPLLLAYATKFHLAFFFGQVFKSSHCCNGILLHTRTRILFAQAKHVSDIFINENAKAAERRLAEDQLRFQYIIRIGTLFIAMTTCNFKNTTKN